MTRSDLLCTVLLSAVGLGSAQATLAANYMDSDCHALKLQDASGVPKNSKRTYEFSGTCNINAVLDSGPKVLRTVPAVASATWDGASLTYVEFFHVLGDVHIPNEAISTGSSFFQSSTMNVGADISTGVVTSTFKCNDDPLVSGAACTLSSHSNLSGYAPFSNAAQKQHRPLLKGKTTLAQATDFSKKHVETVTPAQWPEQKKPVTAKAGSGAPVNVAVPPGQLNVPPSPVKFGSGTASGVVAAPGNEPTLPPGAVRKSGGFVPGSGTTSGAKGGIKGETSGSAQVPAVQVTPGPSTTKVPAVQQGLTSKGGGKVHSQVPAVQTNPGPGGSPAKSRENLRGNLTNSPAEKSAPSVKQGLTAGQ